MKKTMLNHVLMGVIALMLFSICCLIVCIVNRPRYIDISEQENVVINEVPVSDIAVSGAADNASTQLDAASADEDQEDARTADNTRQGKTSTRVNIRDADNATARVLATVEEGTTFEVIENQSNGWTKIIYEGQEAYISSDYVILINN